MSSLSGQNSPGRRSGARSSRASSTIFQKLRKLDREISKVDQLLARFWFSQSEVKKLKNRREKLDEKRKETRHARKNSKAPERS